MYVIALINKPRLERARVAFVFVVFFYPKKGAQRLRFATNAPIAMRLERCVSRIAH